MAPSIRPEDRLFHLILALMATQTGVSKDQILQTVRGYREDIEAGVARSSVERRFERDKDIVRELGIPLEAYIPADDDGNNKNTLYRIPKGQYEPPKEFVLDAQDIRLLNTAAAVWREGSLSTDARVSQTKLASYGADINEPLLGFLPMITARDPALDNIRRALADELQVRFDYLTPGEDTAKTRTVSPLSVVLHESRWHLLSIDEPVGQERTFLLRRIVSPVQILRTPARPAQAGQVERMSGELDDMYWSNTAWISVAPGSVAWVELGHRAGSVTEANRVRVQYTDAGALGTELAAYGPDIRGIDAHDVAKAHRDALSRVVADHGG